jgi:hypothetical protein
MGHPVGHLSARKTKHLTKKPAHLQANKKPEIVGE